MPPLWIIVLGSAGLGFAGGFATGDGVSGVSRAIKWGVIGGGVYLAAKHMKAI